MKTVIKENIAFKDMKKYLPERYGTIFPANFKNREERVNMVIFPYDKHVITSRYIQKALQKIKDFTLVTVYFAHGYSTEAKALIKEKNGLLFYINDFEWTDERWAKVKNGIF